MKVAKAPVKAEEAAPKLSLFDFVNAIHHSKLDLMVDEEAERKYNPYMVNRWLSFSADTIFLANAMNAMPHLDKRLQFAFLLNTVRPMKRYNKWVKGEIPEDVAVIQKYYGYSVAKAKQALRILTPQQVNSIRQRLQTGGDNGT